MTVSSEISESGPYPGNGSATVFPYEFRIFDETHIRVISTESSGVEVTLALGIDYTVTGVDAAVGGNIITAAAPSADQKITILRNPPFTQETDLQNQGAYYAETVERRMDVITMQIQTVKEKSDRSVAIPASADASELDTLVSNILRVVDSAEAIDAVADNIAQVVNVSDNMEDINNAAPNAEAAEASANIALAAAACGLRHRAAAVGQSLKLLPLREPIRQRLRQPRSGFAAI